MPITLQLQRGDERTDELRFEDPELRAAWAARDISDLAILALQRYVERRLAEARGVEPAGRDDREAIRELITHWVEGLAGSRGTIRVVTVGTSGVTPTGGQIAAGPRDQTIRDALVARRTPLLLVYDDHLRARTRFDDLVDELGDPHFRWARADGWSPPMPDADGAGLMMTDRDPVAAVGEVLQAVENGSLPHRAVVALQDLVWDVDGDHQVLATAIPTLWEHLQRIEGLLVLLMPTSQVPPSWTTLFEVHQLRTGASPTPLLDRLGQDLTALARDGRIRPISGRDVERRAVRRALHQATGAAGGVVLVGPLGSGKTAILEQLALDVVADDGDPKLRGKRLILLDMSSLVAGTAARGDLEARISQVIDEAVEHADDVVLVIDEIHTIATTGGAPALEALKAPLARGRIRIVGATTPEDWAVVERSQAAFASRFRKVHVNPPSFQETVGAMATHVPGLEAHHPGLGIAQADLRLLAQAVTDYLPSPPMPRTAVTLLYDAAARADDEGQTRLSEELTYAVLSETIGAPIGPLSESERQTLLGLEQHLNGQILGQSEAMQLIAEAVVAHRLSGVDDGGTFLLLVGQTGCGKTQAAREINALLAPGQPLIEHRMEEYHDRHTGARFLGAPPGYVGYDEGSALVNQVRRTPYRVALLDELEKAHPEVIKQLMNLLVTGRYTDPRGLEGDFRRWVFCATTNLITDEEALKLPLSELIECVADEFAARGVPNEVVGRIGIVVPFRPLTEDVLERIAIRRLEELAERVGRNTQVPVRWRQDVPTFLARRAKQSGLGARNIDQLLRPLRNAWAMSSLDPRTSHRPLAIVVDNAFQYLRLAREG